MVVVESVQNLGSDLYLITWSSDQVISASNPFRIYQDGVLISTQTDTSITVHVSSGSLPVFEILDDSEAVPEPGYPAYSVLSWALDADASAYRIERYNGATWDEVVLLSPDLTTSFQSWQSSTLDDLSTTQYRVLAIDAAGNEGSPTAITVFMVRHPDPPAVSMTFNSGPRTVTIAAA